MYRRAGQARNAHTDRAAGDAAAELPFVCGEMGQLTHELVEAGQVESARRTSHLLLHQLPRLGERRVGG